MTMNGRRTLPARHVRPTTTLSGLLRADQSDAAAPRRRRDVAERQRARGPLGRHADDAPSVKTRQSD